MARPAPTSPVLPRARAGSSGSAPKSRRGFPYLGSLELLSQGGQEALQTVQGAGRAAVLFAHGHEQLIALDHDGLGRLDAKLHLIATHLEDGDLDFIADDDPFVDFSCEDEQRVFSSPLAG